MITFLEIIQGLYMILLAIWTYYLILKSVKEGDYFEEADDERY